MLPFIIFHDILTILKYEDLILNKKIIFKEKVENMNSN